MKCRECGAEVEIGTVICPNCQKEIQIVPDFNIYEDEMFQTVREEELQEQREKELRRKEEILESRRHRQRVLALVISLAAMVIIIVAIVIYISLSNRHRNDNSYEYQMQCANEAYETADYDKALEYLRRALSLDGSSLDARFLMSEIYLDKEDYSGALDVLNEVLITDPNNKEAYAQILAIYDLENDYTSIYNLAKETEDKEILELLDEYLVASPTVSMPGGNYDDKILISFKYDQGLTVYYTTDGSAPSDTNGFVYNDKEIELKEDTVLRAVCMDEEGHLSLPLTENYYIEYVENLDPKVYPETGNYTEETYVSMSAPNGGVIYFTIDGTKPTALSPMYTEPFVLPEGDLYLMAIVIKDGKVSNMVTRTYNYTPQALSEEETAEGEENLE